ncbi:MAG TPA: BatD family protein [Candidatus Gracilibacteria bacterium]
MKRSFSLPLSVLILIGIIFLPSVFAEEKNELQFFSPVSTVRMGETFPLKFQMKKARKDNDLQFQEMTIPGIDNFIVVNSNNSAQVQVSENESGLLFYMEKILKPRGKGDFVLGPIKLPITNEKGEAVFLETGVVRIKVVDANEALITSQNSSEDISEPVFFEKWSIKAMDLWLGLQGVLILGIGLGVWFWGVKPSLKIQGKVLSQKDQRPLEASVIPKIEDPAFWTKIELFWSRYLSSHLGIESPETLTQQEIRKLIHLEADQGIAFTNVLYLWEQHKFSPIPVDKKEMKDAIKKLIMNINQKVGHKLT